MVSRRSTVGRRGEPWLGRAWRGIGASIGVSGWLEEDCGVGGSKAPDMPPGVLMISGCSGSKGAVLGLWKELVGEW
jgi:hypothetical protein